VITLPILISIENEFFNFEIFYHQVVLMLNRLMFLLLTDNDFFDLERVMQDAYKVMRSLKFSNRKILNKKQTCFFLTCLTSIN
jgi:hypothetical protein